MSGRRTPGRRGAVRPPACRRSRGSWRTARGRWRPRCRDVQDIEFTVERGQLWFLQTRAGQAHAARGAEDRRRPGRRRADRPQRGARPARPTSTSPRPASRVSRTPPPAAARGDRRLARRRLRPGVLSRARGRGASPRAASRRSWCAATPRPRTSAGFAAADGILTAVGGRTAHAAVVARQMGKVCLVGCRALAIDEARGAARLGDRAVLRKATGSRSTARPAKFRSGDAKLSPSARRNWRRFCNGRARRGAAEKDFLPGHR